MKKSTPRTFVAGDLENVFAIARREGSLPLYLDEFVTRIREIAARGVLLGGIGVCDGDLQRQTAFSLRDVGIRVLKRPDDDPNSSDLAIDDCLRTQLPHSVDTVVLASGDHIFVDAVKGLVQAGRRVILIAVPGAVSADLYRVVDEYVPLEIAA